MAWWHSTPFHFSANPFKHVIHGPLSSCRKSMSCGSSEPLLHLLHPCHQNMIPRLLPFPLEQRSLSSLPHVFPPIAFQHLWPGNPNGVLGIQNNWISKLSTTPFQSSLDFCIDDGFWCGAERF
ncbi:hypothetical protein AVEN_212517-1 [Araneus ventricosus]|uniref:Uncharacterized protein n=1 Tax=Araneus ventricosus TaxID=182803 RepID=A0A4Y2UNJ9_ARAVE|nr:hypothetical protein AVEN_212517-1 [Araneus ventricosus]